MKFEKLSIQKSILIGSVIIGLFIYAGQISSQKASPKDEKTPIEAVAETNVTGTEIIKETETIPEVERISYPVFSVTDGDTLKLTINGINEPIRLIGIDTPETVHPTKPVQCFGVEASNKAKEILTGQNVFLEKEPSQGERDKYDRLLGYIILEDGRNFNKLMIEEGYAYEYTYNLPYKYQAEFKQAQINAKENKKGLWAEGVCEEVSQTQTTNITTTPPPAPTAEVDSSTCTIKGNIGSSDEKIFHVVGCGSYSKTKIDESQGERWFCSEQEALNAGWRKALNC